VQYYCTFLSLLPRGLFRLPRGKAWLESRTDIGLQADDYVSISIVIARSVLCDEAIWFSTAPKYEIASSLRSSQ
jgi:hypothetical protein